jgi:hypothetical protein
VAAACVTWEAPSIGVQWASVAGDDVSYSLGYSPASLSQSVDPNQRQTGRMGGVPRLLRLLLHAIIPLAGCISCAGKCSEQ